MGPKFGRLAMGMILTGALNVHAEEQAAAPPLLDYQAVLRSSTGDPVITATTVVFSIWDAQSGGSPVWTETRSVTPDVEGKFSLQLGEATPLSDNVFSAEARWLGIKVGSDVTEVSPRSRLTASPYSFRVNTLDRAKGGRIESNITVHTEIALEGARLTLLGPANDTVIFGGVHTGSAMRATNAAGQEVMAMRVDGNAALLMKNTAGDSARYTPDEASFFSEAATATGEAGIAANVRRFKISPEGMAMYDASGLVPKFRIFQDVDGPRMELKGSGGQNVFQINSVGGARLTSMNISTSAATLSARAASAVCTPDTNKLGDGSGNNAVGNNNNLSTATNSFAVGQCNVINQVDAAVVIGSFNHLTAAGSPFDANGSVIMGDSNFVNQPNCFAMGLRDSVRAPYSLALGRDITIFGSGRSFATGDNHFVINAGNAAILGGDSDSLISASNCGIVSGQNNVINNVGWASIGGGSGNRIDGTVHFDFGNIGGGVGNVLTGPMGVIGGGEINRVAGQWATVGGGADNHADAGTSTIGGGNGNRATGLVSTIAGGGGSAAEKNTASGNYTAIGGGSRNVASGLFGSVPGGNLNTAGGAYSLAAGRRAKANHDGSFVWGDQTDADFASTAANQFLIRAGGGVGIGTSAPSVALDVVGSICYSGSIGACSDVRYKKNVENLTGALSQISRLRSVSYEWKTVEFPEHKFAAGRQIGFLAQEVKEVVPEIVSQGKDGYYSVDYGRLTPVLVQAIQELQAINAEKDRELEVVRSRMSLLESTLETLMARLEEQASGDITLSALENTAVSGAGRER